MSSRECQGLSPDGVGMGELAALEGFALHCHVDLDVLAGRGDADVPEPGLDDVELVSIRKFKNSFPGALRPTSGIVGQGAVKGAAVPCSDASGARREVERGGGSDIVYRQQLPRSP